MSLSNAGNGSGGRLSAIGAVRLRRFRRLPTDPAAPDRLVPQRLAGVLDGLSDACPTVESAPVADVIAVELDLVELDLVELDLGAGAPDTGRHRRPGLSTPEDPTGLLLAEMDLGPEVAEAGRHRRPGLSTPEDPAGLVPAEMDLAPDVSDTGRHRGTGSFAAEDTAGLIQAEMDLAPEVADSGRHRRSAPPLTSEVPQQGSGSEPPRPTHSKWGARRMLAHMDSSALT
jgi:hypothetical protein